MPTSIARDPGPADWGAALLRGSLGVMFLAHSHADSAAEVADFERPYPGHWLRFIVLTDIRTVAVAPTLPHPVALRAAQAAANRHAAVAAVL